MKRRPLFYLSGILLGLLTASCLFIAIARYAVVSSAEKRADIILSQVESDDPQKIAVEVTRYLFAHFHKGEFYDHPVMGRLRPYFSNARLPDIIRIPPGTYELLTMEGWCDDAARALTFILDRKNISTVWWDMMTPSYGGHTVRLVDTDRGRMLADPYFGYVTVIKDKPLDPEKIRRLMASDNNMDHYFLPLGEASLPDFYTEFASVQMGEYNTKREIKSFIPDLGKQGILVLGAFDGSSKDMKHALQKRGMTEIWTYIGHKYDRGWIRTLHAESPAKVEMILISPPDRNVLRTLRPPPRVEGNKLTWNLSKDEEIISEDGLAAISLRRLNSYIGVDQIVITPQGATP